MARIDRERFPKLIMQIPEDRFPSKLTINITGRKYLADPDARITQLAKEAKTGVLGQPITPTYFGFFVRETDFTKTINGKKVAELKTPWDEIVEITGYAKRDDPEDDESIPVTTFTATQSKRPSSRTTTYNLDGVFAYNFTMAKRSIDSDYITQYVIDATTAGNIASIMGQMAQYIPQVISIITNPSLPTPQQIASKLLGPASAAVQNKLAENAATVATIKKEAEKIMSVLNQIQTVIQNPEQAIPILASYLVQWIGQENLGEIIYPFRG